MKRATLMLAVLGMLALLGGPVRAGSIFNYTGTVQTFTVATTGVYDITAFGGQGGGSGGLGAEVSGSIPLTAGQVLQIIVGGQGATGTQGIGGGGGGTFVYISGPPSPPLLVAGGGGGGGAFANVGDSGQSGMSGTTGLFGGPGGTNGSGGGQGGSLNNGGGGAGWLGNGGSTGSDGQGGFGPPTFAGGSGGNGAGSGAFGGGGGGGNVGGSGGGGGGYSGGGGGGAVVGGGGGGSFIAASFTNTTALSGVNSGNGLVDIASAVPEPSTAILAALGAVALSAYGWSRHRRDQRRQAVA